MLLLVSIQLLSLGREKDHGRWMVAMRRRLGRVRWPEENPSGEDDLPWDVFDHLNKKYLDNVGPLFVLDAVSSFPCQSLLLFMLVPTDATREQILTKLLSYPSFKIKFLATA
jgi:hypothetical protein